VHALTDVTGFGLLGHLLELVRGAGLSARLNMEAIPFLPQVQQLAEQGCITGASARNWQSYGHDVTLASTITPLQQALLTDPQTAGGLLVSCAPHAVEKILALFADEGFAHAAVIGEMIDGAIGIEVA
jgi:selenide,water dikinase